MQPQKKNQSLAPSVVLVDIKEKVVVQKHKYDLDLKDSSLDLIYIDNSLFLVSKKEVFKIA